MHFVDDVFCLFSSCCHCNPDNKTCLPSFSLPPHVLIQTVEPNLRRVSDEMQMSHALATRCPTTDSKFVPLCPSSWKIQLHFNVVCFHVLFVWIIVSHDADAILHVLSNHCASLILETVCAQTIFQVGALVFTWMIVNWSKIDWHCVLGNKLRWRNNKNNWFWSKQLTCQLSCWHHDSHTTFFEAHNTNNAKTLLLHRGLHAGFCSAMNLLVNAACRDQRFEVLHHLHGPSCCLSSSSPCWTWAKSSTNANHFCAWLESGLSAKGCTYTACRSVVKLSHTGWLHLVAFAPLYWTNDPDVVHVA